MRPATHIDPYNVEVSDSADLRLRSDRGNALENQTAMDAYLSVFVCPSDTSPIRFGPPGPNSYRVNIGPSPYYWDHDDDRYPGGGGGAFAMGRALVPANFADGLSQTAMMSEKLMGDDDPAAFRPMQDFWGVGFPNSGVDYPPVDRLVAICASPPSGNPAHDSDGGRSWYIAGFDDTWYNHTIVPNSLNPNCKVNGMTPPNDGNFGGLFGASSAHSRGVHCLIADGAVRFVGDSVDLQVWRALATRAGGEPLSALRW